MHAIGEGLLIAEIQQASNTTFRVYDWGRVDQDGTQGHFMLNKRLPLRIFAGGPSSLCKPMRLLIRIGRKWLGAKNL